MYLPIFKANHVCMKPIVNIETVQGDKKTSTYAKHRYHEVSQEEPDRKIEMSEIKYPYYH
jgi:hypothetical protein